MKAVIDTAIAAVAAVTLVIVTTQGEELGKAQQSLIKDTQAVLGAKK